jgi:hypothetical protein
MFYTGELYGDSIPQGKGLLFNSEEQTLFDGDFEEGEFKKGKKTFLKDKTIEHFQTGIFKNWKLDGPNGVE